MRERLVMGLVMLLITAMAFATGTQEAQDSGETTVTAWVTSYIPTQELEKPQEEWYFTQAIDRFEAANPGVTVDWTYQDSQSQIPNLLKAAEMAGTAPDLINVWTGMMMQSIKDILMPLDEYITDDDLDTVIGWDTVRENLDPNGAILGVPILGSELCVVYYNKQLVQNAGLDFEADPPETVDEFFDALAALKATGVTPFAHDEGRSPRILVFFAWYWWAQQSGYPRIVSNGVGETPYSTDEGFLRTLETYRRLYTEGYLNEDLASSQDTRERMINDRVAMVPGGNWQLSYYDRLGADIGVIKSPDFNATGDGLLFTDRILGGPGQALVVSAGSENPEEAVALARFLNSHDENLEQCLLNPRIPINATVTVDELGWEGHPILEKFMTWGQDIAFWVDNSTQQDVYSEIERIAVLYLTGQMTQEEFTARLDETAAEAAAAR